MAARDAAGRFISTSSHIASSTVGIRITVNQASRRLLDNLIKATHLPNFRRDLQTELGKIANRVAGKIARQAPFNIASSRAYLLGRPIKEGLGGIEISADGSPEAADKPFSIPISDTAKAKGNRDPSIHPQRLVMIRYRSAVNRRVVAGLYAASDLAQNRALRAIPTHYLLATQFRLAPQLLRARVQATFFPEVKKLERRIARILRAADRA